MRRISKAGVVLGLLSMGAYCVEAQSLAESATTPSQSASTAQTVNAPPVAVAVPEKQNTSGHPLEPTAPSSEDKNRRNFEDNAGETAGKLLLRSSPSGAEIFINNLFVGRTPLLMVVAPGKYNVDMRGPRQEFEHSTVGVMPKETQTVMIKLNQRYPASMGVRWPGQ